MRLRTPLSYLYVTAAPKVPTSLYEIKPRNDHSVRR